MNAAQVVVGVVSLAVIAAPFVLAWRERDEEDGFYRNLMIGVGVLALFWVGVTGAGLIARLGEVEASSTVGTSESE